MTAWKARARTLATTARPNVFNREEYRYTNVPPEVRRDYLRGFRRGYEMAANRLWGGGM